MQLTIQIKQERNPLRKPFLCASDFVQVFGKNCCSISQAYKLIHRIQETTDKDGNPLFDVDRCPRKNTVPLSVFIKYFNIDKKSIKDIVRDD